MLLLARRNQRTNPLDYLDDEVIVRRYVSLIHDLNAQFQNRFWTPSTNDCGFPVSLQVLLASAIFCNC